MLAIIQAPAEQSYSHGNPAPWEAAMLLEPQLGFSSPLYPLSKIEFIGNYRSFETCVTFWPQRQTKRATCRCNISRDICALNAAGLHITQS